MFSQRHSFRDYLACWKIQLVQPTYLEIQLSITLQLPHLSLDALLVWAVFWGVLLAAGQAVTFMAFASE